MILARLRETTRPLHEQLESEMPLLRPDFSLDDYRTLLGRFYGFLLPLNAAVFEHAEWQSLPGDWAERHRFNRIIALQNDLQHLGVEDPAKQFPICEAVPEVSTFAQALGCAYVFEGSTLGGQIIARHLGQKFGIDADSGASYFTAYGAQTGVRWKEFCNALESFASQNDNNDSLIDAACITACGTFELLRGWLSLMPVTEAARAE